MREPKVRVGVRASVAEGSVGERVSGEGKALRLCQLPTLTGVGNFTIRCLGCLDFEA